MESQFNIFELAGILLIVGLLYLNIFQWYRNGRKNKSVKDRSAILKAIQHTMEAIQVGMWEYRPAPGKIILNDLKLWHVMLGHTFKKGEITVGEFSEFVHPDDMPAVLTTNREFIASGGKGDLEVQFRLRCADGEWRWILSKGKTVEWNKDGIPSRILGIDINIQTLKEVENQIRQSELKFKTIFENAPYTISIHSLDDGKYIEANQAFLDIYKISKEELCRLSPADLNLLSPEAEKRLLIQLNKDGIVTKQEALVTRKNGEQVYLRFSCVIMELQGRKQALSITEDITEQKKVEKALKESEMRFRMLFKKAPVPMAHISLNGEILDLNERLTQTMGHTLNKAQTLEQAWQYVFPDPELRKKITTQWRKNIEGAIANNGEVAPFECPLQFMDGSSHDIIISTRLINDSIIVSFFDITARKKGEAEREKLQKQLHQSQKLEAIGILAGGVAHDFNNMLGSIMGYSELTLVGMEPDNPFRDNLQNILKATRKSADLTRQLLTFARKQNIEPVTLDLNESIESVLKLIRRIIGENIELIWKPGEHPCRVNMDPTQLDQILVNFCVNAKDAIDGIGKISIETDVVTFTDSGRPDDKNIRNGKYIMLAVADDGSGIDNKTMEHIFEPFYTTKAEGKGTGLGLATVYGIVQQNKGFINVFSELKKGTTFKVYIPAAHETSSLKLKENNDSIPYGNGETVLVVEDDETVLSIAVMMLKKLGYNAISAITPKEALEIIEEINIPVHVLITDVVMPGMNGSELAQRININFPEIKTLFMSGYEDAVIANEGILEKGSNFIQKPFSISDLAVTMCRVLDKEN